MHKPHRNGTTSDSNGTTSDSTELVEKQTKDQIKNLIYT